MGTAREEQDVPKSGFNEDQSGKGDTRNGNANQVQTEEGCRLIKATATTSDDIIQDLLNDMRNSEKPFSVEDITSTRREKEKKKHKDHKHKKSKKKKKHHSKHDKSRSRSRDRSHSRPRKTKHRKRSQSKNHSHSASSTSSVENRIMDEPKVSSPVFVDPVPDQISDDDDLPVGADYRTVMKEAKMTINISSSLVSGIDLSVLPSEKPLHSQSHFNAFPLSKETKKDEDDGDIPEKRESEVLKKVIAVKGKGDFVPRNLKVKSSNNDSPVPSTQVVINQSEVEPATNQEASIIPNIKAGSPSEVSEEEFGPVMPPPTKDPEPEPISDGELEKEIEREIQEAGRNEKAGKENDRWSKDVENSVDSATKKNCYMSKEADKRTRKRRRSRSTSPDTDQEIKARASRSANRIYRRSRSPDRSRDWRRSDRRRSRSRCCNRSRRRPSRSHSRDRFRRRSRSRSCSRDRYRNRRSWSRSRSRSRDVERSETCKDKGIDKAKLLAIARKKAQKMQALGISIDQTDKNPKSIDDFVSYCQKIQRKQDKEDRREKGETVSSDDEASDDEKNSSNFKHPFGVKAAEPIKINIVNATPIPTKTSQERVLDSSQLRIVFPVSSGAVHKESVENVNGWTPVTKQEPLKTCSIEQKKYVAITSMDAEKARQHEKKATSISSLSLPLLPPPPLPPVLTGLGGLLPPPPPPPKLTAFDCLLPPPPPLPPMLIIPSEENLIMSEPIRTETAAPKDVSRVLAQRAAAQRTLNENPNDFDAIKKLKDADDQMEAWAATKNLPGKFTGSTGLNILKPEELQPQDPRYNAWVRKDMFKTARPSVGGVGMRLMQKMGWRFGEGLGKEGTGNLEPLTLDVKSDRKGLLAREDLTPIYSKAIKSAAPDVAGKHPVSLVMELCAKRKWAAPVFTCMESGPPNQRVFLWKVVVNGTEYQPISASRSKKDAKSVACQVVLQSLGLVPRDSNLPVLI